MHLNWVPPKDRLKSLLPVPVNVALFRNRVFADKIKKTVKMRSYLCTFSYQSRMGPNLMMDGLIQRGNLDQTHLENAV